MIIMLANPVPLTAKCVQVLYHVNNVNTLVYVPLPVVPVDMDLKLLWVESTYHTNRLNVKIECVWNVPLKMYVLNVK